MYQQRIKLVSRGSTPTSFSFYKQQSPKNLGEWRNCQFIFDPLEDRYDWFVIIDNMPTILPNTTENLKCPKENTILVTTEPSSISRYGQGFAGQFYYLITNQNEKILPHTNEIRSQTGIYWLYGKDFDDIIKDTHLPKTKPLSTICSSKRSGHTIHKKRFDFTKIMEEAIPELDRFGRGFKFIEKKYEALDPYEFHVVIENHIEKHMWSEKLADAFLGFTIPIYYGCPNIYDYFPEDSIILIDINDIESSIETIKKIISTPGEYERRFEALKEARRRVIYEYNLLAMISNIVEKSPKYEATPGVRIFSRRKMRAKNISDFVQFSCFKMNNFIKNVVSKFQ